MIKKDEINFYRCDKSIKFTDAGINYKNTIIIYQYEVGRKVLSYVPERPLTSIIMFTEGLYYIIILKQYIDLSPYLCIIKVYDQKYLEYKN